MPFSPLLAIYLSPSARTLLSSVFVIFSVFEFRCVCVLYLQFVAIILLRMRCRTGAMWELGRGYSVSISFCNLQHSFRTVDHGPPLNVERERKYPADLALSISYGIVQMQAEIFVRAENVHFVREWIYAHSFVYIRYFGIEFFVFCFSNNVKKWCTECVHITAAQHSQRHEKKK